MVLITKNNWWGWSTNDKWYFATELALTTAYPVWQDWRHAILGSTDTVWIWDSDTTAWVDSWITSQTTRIDLTARRTAEPTEYDVQATYTVYEYTYWSTNYYRRVYNTYDPATDIFYAESALSTIIASRALSI